MKKRLLLAAAMILSVGGLSTCGNGRLSEFGARSSEKTVESKESQTLKKVPEETESRANSGQVAAKRLNQRKHRRSKRCLRHRKVRRIRGR